VNKAYPYPEIVTGETWTVHQTTENSPIPKTDNLNRQMYVPLDRECNNCGINHSRYIRRHELGHAKWSPKTMGKLKPEVRKEAVEVLEEIRINFLLCENMVGIDEPVICLDKIEEQARQIVYEGSLTDIILFTMAGMWEIKTPNDQMYRGYDKAWCKEYEIVEKLFWELIDSKQITEIRKAEITFVKEIILNYYRELVAHYDSYGTISYRKVQKLAEKLSLILEEFIEKPKLEDIYIPESELAPSNGNEESDDEESDEEEYEEGEESFSGTGDATEFLEKRMRKDLIKRMNYQSGTGMGSWGTMETHKPPLTVNLQGRLKGGRQYRPMDFGYNPKYINRFCVDKKIFKQKLNVLGGTILIDASGSMHFDGDDILEILKILPAATIAMYNGGHLQGDLWIIARNGMRVPEEKLDIWSGRGNVVDGPALDWLASMPARRIWVSDMYVFGAGNNSNGFNLLKECYDKVRKHQIINLKDIEEVKTYGLKLNLV
tara:strand:- start:1925 stop:3391 length:1467 start_codon:yes stop_codon:yes gene_type:complete